MSSGRIRSALLWAIAVLAIASCGPGPEQQKTSLPSLPTEHATFDFQLSSYSNDPQSGFALSVGMGSGDLQPLSYVPVDGELLVVPHRSDQASQKYTFSLELDENAIAIRTVVDLDLPTGAYDFYFLLKPRTGLARYGGYIYRQLIVGGYTNPITMQLDPILGVSVNSVEEMQALVPFSVGYDPDLIAGFSRPRIGVTVDGFGEYVFDVRNNPLSPQVYLYLQPGIHQVNVRFFDGAIVKDISIEKEVDLPPPDPGSDVPPPQISLTPLTAEATYHFTPGPSSTLGSATFDFKVPQDVVREVGGAGTPDNPLSDRLLAVASIVGPENALFEQTLTLTPELDAEGLVQHYTGSLSVAPFVPGPITWQLKFVDPSQDQVFAYCARSVDTTDTPTPNEGSFSCDLQLLVRLLANTDPTGSVDVSVSDGIGWVSGAVVLLDGKPLGVTGGGDPGETLGHLLTFVKPGDYDLKVVDELLDPFGSGQVYRRASPVQPITIAPQLVTAAPVVLPDFPFGAPAVTGTSPTDHAQDVAVDTSIAVTFTRRMNRATTQGAFSISPATEGTYDWSGNDRVLTFTPNTPLEYVTEYEVRISEGATDVLGIALQDDYEFEFKTGVQPDYTPPTVTDVTPAPGAVNVDRATTVTITFSEPMNTGSVEANFATVPHVDGTIQWSGGNAVMTFLPDGGLAYDTQYAIGVDTGARDASGNPLQAAFSSVFTTGSEPDLTPPEVVSTQPGDGAQGVSVDAPVVVAFSETMDPGSVEAAFGTQPHVNGHFAWSEAHSELTFQPAEPLHPDATYRVTIGKSAMDAAGNHLPDLVQIGFRTAPPPPPDTVLTLEASRTRWPLRYHDGAVDIDAPITVRIPSMEQVQVALDEDGNPLGDPERFLLFLYLGDVKCVYVGGHWDRYIGEVVEHFFEDAFQSPMCSKGYRHDGGLVTIQPNPEPAWAQHYGRGQDDDDDRFNRAEIRARVMTGSPFFHETRLQITIEVVNP